MSFIMQTYKRFPLEFVKGEGSYLLTEKGKRFIDFSSGISVVNLGHANQEITNTICTQAATLLHTSNLYENKLQSQLAEKISTLGFDSKVFFCNSGAEANEAAIKLARIIGNKKYNSKKYRIITMENSFHGRTFNTLSATGQDKIKDGFRPTVDYFTHVPFNNLDAIKSECAKDDVVAIMLELVHGEGGLELADINYIKALKIFCDENEILLIFDEIQTAIGRTGKLFAFQHYGIEPDVITLAKALGNGLPIGAMAAKPEYAKYLSAGTHGSTFGGNFLVCAVANKVLDIIANKEFLKNVNDNSDYMRDKLTNIFKDKGILKGMSLMLGVEFIDINNLDFINKCHEEGLLLIPAGNNTVRIYPPLNVSKKTINEALIIIEKVFKSFTSKI